MAARPTEDDQPEMTWVDRTIQAVAIGFAMIGLATICYFLFLLADDGYSIDRSGSVDIEKTGQVGDFIGGLAGSLFALTATLLFYLTLTLQRREFRNSLRELRISNDAFRATEKHHRDSLKVMREEKEFNVCVTAINALWSDWKEIVEGASQNRGKWYNVTSMWLTHFSPTQFFGPSGLWRKYVGNEKGLEPPINEWVRMSDIVQRIFWISTSIREKSLQDDDREYLKQLARPVARSIHDKFDPLLKDMIEKIDRLLSDSAKLEQKNVAVNILMFDREYHFVRLRDRCNDAVTKLDHVQISAGQRVDP